MLICAKVKDGLDPIYGVWKMSSLKGKLIALCVVVGFLGAYFAFGPNRTGPITAINVGETDAAIHGYDPVAYFTLGKPTEGTSQISYEHEGATFHFSSTEHRDLFAADTDRYAPAYGGFCAYGVTQKQKFDIDPNAWEIVDGRLFLQLDPGTRSVWLEKRDDHIETADSFWPEIQSVPADEL